MQSEITGMAMMKCALMSYIATAGATEVRSRVLWQKD